MTNNSKGKKRAKKENSYKKILHSKRNKKKPARESTMASRATGSRAKTRTSARPSRGKRTRRGT